MPTPYSYTLAARFTLPAGAPDIVDFSTFGCVSLVEPIDTYLITELVTLARSRVPVAYGWWRDIQIQAVVDPGSNDDLAIQKIRRYMALAAIYPEMGIIQETTLNYADGAAAVWRLGYFSSATHQKLQGVNVARVYDIYFKCQDLLRDLPAGDLAGPPVMTGP